MSQSNQTSKVLFVVEGASLSLLLNDMAVRRGRKYHLATNLNTFDERKLQYDIGVRTLCNLVVYNTKENEYHEADCRNCLTIAKQKGYDV